MLVDTKKWSVDNFACQRGYEASIARSSKNVSVLWHCGSRSWNDGKGFNGLISRKTGISNETMVTEKR